MKTQLIIPKKIKIGFNLRPDTYSGKLGYVIYHDGKIWRKEQSWESWRQKEATESDKEKCVQDYTKNYYEPYHKSNPTIYPQALNYNEVPEFYKRQFKFADGVEPIECDNVPTEGFVLNRNVGGVKESYGYHDDVRIEKVRVFDPRGFEFEIDIPNVLTILQECTSVKGKGLEGTFVYAWDGKELVLLPTCSPDYQSCLEFTKMQNNKVSAKTLIPGCSYKTKKQKDLIFLGKLDWIDYNYKTDSWEANKKFIFVNEHPDNYYGGDENDIVPEDFETEEEYQNELKNYRELRKKWKQQEIEQGKDVEFVSLQSVSSLALCNSDTPVSNYAELMDRFNSTKHASKPVEFVEEEVICPLNAEKNEYVWWTLDFKRKYFIKSKKGVYNEISLSLKVDYNNRNEKPTEFSFYPYYSYSLKNNKIKKQYITNGYNWENKKYHQIKDYDKLNFVNLNVRLENNKIIKAEEYN